MRLIPEWRRCITLRTYSTAAMTAAASMQGAWMALPREWTATIPDDWIRSVTIVVLALGFVGRLVDQGVRDEKHT